MIGKQCLIRTYSAGVHFGTLLAQKKREVTLGTARRIWLWKGANTLNEIAVSGINKDGSRVSVPVEIIVLTEAVEIIPMTDKAVSNLALCGWGS